MNDSTEVRKATLIPGIEEKEVTINLAAWCPSTRSLGPGTRAVLWVQGCPFSCPGCLSPDWARQNIFNQVSAADVLRWLLNIPQMTGLTISGGEPMLQAAGLSRLVYELREKRDVDVICYTGYRMEELVDDCHVIDGVLSLLSCIDVLIDGPYVAALNDNRGLRGSSNQRVHYLTERLRGNDFVSSSRSVELMIEGDEVLSVGIPERDFCQVIDSAFCSMGYLLLGG